MKTACISLAFVLLAAVPPAAQQDLGTEYARTFSIERGDGWTLIDVPEPFPNAPGPLAYLLLERGRDLPSRFRGIEELRVLRTPLERIVATTTTILPMIEELDALNTLVGVDNLQFLYSESIRSYAEEEDLAEIGSGASMNLERLIALEPDVVLVNAFGGQFDTHEQMLSAGLPVMILADWLEQDPLGRAEYLKLVGLLLGEYDRAARIFAETASRYEDLRGLAAGVERRPTAFLNAPFQGTWSIAASDSYAAQFLEDAGAAYIFDREAGTGARFFDFETVLDRAGNAEYWLNPGVADSLQSLLNQDERFSEFAAVQEGRVYNYTRRVGPAGGFDYFESGPSNPDVVLADLISIFHPDLLPDHERFYYERLD